MSRAPCFGATSAAIAFAAALGAGVYLSALTILILQAARARHKQVRVVNLLPALLLAPVFVRVADLVRASLAQ